MPTQNDVGIDSELYRAILEYDHQPKEYRPNPDYVQGVVTRGYVPPSISVPVGPVEVRERVIGPYQSIAPIKAYVSRNRGRYRGNGLRIKEVQRVARWEKVDI